MIQCAARASYGIARRMADDLPQTLCRSTARAEATADLLSAFPMGRECIPRKGAGRRNRLDAGSFHHPAVPAWRRKIINRECWRLAAGHTGRFETLRAAVTAAVAGGATIEAALMAASNI
jgi:hypothetical protein